MISIPFRPKGVGGSHAPIRGYSIAAELRKTTTRYRLHIVPAPVTRTLKQSCFLYAIKLAEGDCCTQFTLRYQLRNRGEQRAAG